MAHWSLRCCHILMSRPEPPNYTYSILPCSWLLSSPPSKKKAINQSSQPVSMREMAVQTQITWIAEVPPEVPEHTSLDSLSCKRNACLPEEKHPWGKQSLLPLLQSSLPCSFNRQCSRGIVVSIHCPKGQQRTFRYRKTFQLWKATLELPHWASCYRG